MGTLAAVGLLAAERHRTPDRRGAAGRALALRRRLRDGRQPRPDRRGDARRPATSRRTATTSTAPSATTSRPATGGGVMVVALTARQWKALRRGDRDRRGLRGHRARHRPRPRHRDRPLRGPRPDRRRCCGPGSPPATCARSARRFAGTGVSWGPYQTFRQLVDEDPRCSTANPMFDEVEHPGVGTYLMPGSPLDFSASSGRRCARAPLLGEHTEEVLADVLGLSGAEIGRLHDDGVVAGPELAPDPTRYRSIDIVEPDPARRRDAPRV